MKSFSHYLSEDYDGEMAISQLRSIIENVNELLSMMSSETNLEPWVQSKLTKAQDYVSVVHDYMSHNPDSSVEEGSLLPSEKNDQRNYRKTSSGSEVGMKYYNKMKKPNAKPDAAASFKAKQVHKGKYHA